MPRPAQCCRSEQAIVKMAPASDLSLRGGQRPTWQSRSTRPHRGKATGETATAFPRLPRRFAPRNDTSGEREVHQCPPTVELLPTGRSLSAATGPVGAVTILTAACANRLCSAGRGMPLPYNGGYHETAAGTGRQYLPEIATSAVGLLAMTNSGASRHKINAVNAASLHKP